MLIREDPTIDELAGLWEREENEVQLGEFDAIQGYSESGLFGKTSPRS